MGYIHEPHGPFEIETRMESFIIHREGLERHPEFGYEDLGHLIDALTAIEHRRPERERKQNIYCTCDRGIGNPAWSSWCAVHGRGTTP